MEKNNLGKSSTGIEANAAGAACYVLGWVTGLIFFLIEKDNKFVRYHALQSMITFGAINVISSVLSSVGYMLLGINQLLPLIISSLGTVWLILTIVLAVKAYQGQKLKLPIAGDIAEQHSK